MQSTQSKTYNNVGKILRFIIFFICVISMSLTSQAGSNANSQKPAFNFSQPIINKNDISSQWVIDSLQGPDGFMWVGTQRGLYRYDGEDFKLFKFSETDPNSLPDNYINAINKDRENNLWFATDGGLARYDADKENFISYRQQPGDNNSINNDIVMASIVDEEGIIWVATWGGGLNVIDPKSNTVIHYKHNPEDTSSISGNHVYSLMEDSNGNIWLGTRNAGLNKFNKTSKKFTRYLHDPKNPNSLSHNRVSSIIEDSTGLLWIGTRKEGLNTLNPQTGLFQRYKYDPNNKASIGSNEVLSIFEDNDNSIWVGTNQGGLSRFTRNTNDFQRFKHSSEIETSISSDNIWSITQNEDGYIWLSTFGGGVNMFNPQSDQSSFTKHDNAISNSLTKGLVTAILEVDDGNLWVGTDFGINYREKSANGFQHFTHDADNHESLSDNFVTVIFQDSKKNMWFGTKNGGLNLLDSSRKSFIRFQHQANNKHSISDNNIASITEDRFGNLWIGTDKGLNKFNEASNNFEHFFHDVNDKSSLGSDRIEVVLTSLEGELWIGTSNGGLNKFNYETQSFTRFLYGASNDDAEYHRTYSIAQNKIYSIAQHKKGELWLATEGGLSKFSINDKKFTRFGKKHGLSFGETVGVMFDKQDNIWLIGRKITKFNPLKNIAIHNVDQYSNCALRLVASFYQSPNGKLYFGGEGLCSFFPDQFKLPKLAPKIALTDFLILNKSVDIQSSGADSPLTQSIIQASSLTLDYTLNVFSLRFSALDFVNPETIEYQYKLEGFNSDWLTTDANNRIATYTNLSPGKYVFKVKGKSSLTPWNSTVRELVINITPPFWRTWWAYTFYILALLFTFYILIRKQQRKVTEARELSVRLEKMVDERTEKLKQANKSLESLSYTDQLTQLKNRHFLSKHIKSDIDLSLRKYFSVNENNLPINEADIVFFLIDLDHFKQVNDLYGHAAGDSVLINIKEILNEVFRESDYLIRWGGEEFLVVARFSNRGCAPEIAERLRHLVESYNFDIGEGRILRKTCSIGFASFPFIIESPELMSWEQVVDIADHSLYAAKRSSRNCWVGLENIDCSADNLFDNVTNNTEELIKSNHLKSINSSKINGKLKWDNIN